MPMKHSAKIFVTGHRGMVGSALVRRLQAGGWDNLLLRSHAELDLLDQRAAHAFLAEQQPDYIFIAAAKVDGIQANNLYRAGLTYQNLAIEANLIHGAHLAGVRRLISDLGRRTCRDGCRSRAPGQVRFEHQLGAKSNAAPGPKTPHPNDCGSASAVRFVSWRAPA
jgi:nucleoside-diphosphate-sugar epimerase